MKAMRYHGFGGPELLRPDELPRPRPSAGELLLDVAASSVNPVDWKIGAGHLRGLFDMAPPFVPGTDFSGIIIGMAADVAGFALGDRVFGAAHLDHAGALAEWITMPASVVAHAPASIPLTTAAAVPLAALTAWHALTSPEHAALRPGQTVLIHGAAGGTGVFAVQFARYLGARVVATGSARNAELLRRLGADLVIEARSSGFGDVVGPLDVVLDLVGDDLAAQSMPLVRAGGAFASIAAIPEAGLGAHHGLRASFVNMTGRREPRMLDRIAGLIDSGAVEVVVSGRHALADAAAAYAASRAGHVRAKLLIEIGGEP